LHGLYCAIGTATTVGCDIPPATGPAYVLTVAMMVTVVPLFAAVFSFFTSGLTAGHVDALTDQQTRAITGHVDAKTEQQTSAITGHVDAKTEQQTTEIKSHVSG
jgi:HAMP domain-containing protein